MSLSRTADTETAAGASGSMLLAVSRATPAITTEVTAKTPRRQLVFISCPWRLRALAVCCSDQFGDARYGKVAVNLFASGPASQLPHGTLSVVRLAVTWVGSAPN